jgi:predicted RNA-binding Zn ribbon-like protein
MLEDSISSKTLRAIGGSLSIGFANTLVYRKDEVKKDDKLKDFTRLIRWADEMGLLTGSESQKLKHQSKKRPEEAATVWKRALFLRETIVRIFEAIAGGQDATPEDVSSVNAMLSETLSRLRIIPSKRAMKWTWAGWCDSLDSILWPLIYSTANLLTSSALFYVKECNGRGCGWFFIDTSRNQIRRWCSMSDCGNREKVRRFYERKKAKRHNHKSKVTA